MVKILLANDDNNLASIKDYSDITSDDKGLIGQLLAEIEIIKLDLLEIYLDGRDD